MIKQLMLILGLCSQILFANVAELENLRGKYKAGSQKIEHAHQVGKDNLKTYYSDQLVKLEHAALEAGRLDDVLVIRKEIKYFGKYNNYKSKLVQNQIEELKSAMMPKKELVDELKETRYESLHKTYVKYLAALVIELTKQSRIKEALIVRREQTKYAEKPIGDLAPSENKLPITSNPGRSVESQAHESARRPRELIPGEEAPGEYKTPQLVSLQKHRWLSLNLQKIASEYLFRIKDEQVEIYLPKKEEWKIFTQLKYSEGILRIKEIDYKWDSQKGYFAGTKNAEEFILVQDSKSAQVKKLFSDEVVLATKESNKKPKGNKGAKVAKQKPREEIKSKSVKSKVKKLKKKNT